MEPLEWALLVVCSSAEWIICYPIISDRDCEDFHEGVYADDAGGADHAVDVVNGDAADHADDAVNTDDADDDDD